MMTITVATDETERSVETPTRKLSAAEEGAVRYSRRGGKPWTAPSSYTRKIINVLNGCRVVGQPVLLWGEPGTGKTALIGSLAAAEGLLLVPFIGASKDPTDVEGNPIVSTDERGRATTVNAVPLWLKKIEDVEGRAVLFFDELNTATPSVQASELSVVHGRRAGLHKVPDNTWILAAANPPEQAADGWTLAAPLANRFVHITWNPPVEDWILGLSVAFGANVGERETKERSIIAAFLRRYPALIQAMPKDPNERGGAWPSRRTWDAAAKGLAFIDGGEERTMLLTGLVGESAATQFEVWRRDLDLPEVADVLRDPRAIPWKTQPVDRTFAILSQVLGFTTKENHVEAVEVFVAAAEAGKTDVAGSLVPELIDRIPREVDFPRNLIKAFREALDAAGIM